MKTAILGGRLVDPANRIDARRNLFIDRGRVAGVGRRPSGFREDQVIDATGRYVLPGVIDLCARLREPGGEHDAGIESETRAAAAGGITGLVCPPDTVPIIDTPAMAQMIRNRAEKLGHARVHPLGALTVGLEGQRLTDMATLMDAGCVGVSNAWNTVENTLVMRRAMQYASTFDLPVFLTPRDEWLQGNGVVHEGEVSTRLGLPAVPEAAETVGVARDLALIETSGARAHLSRLSCARSVTMLAEARKRDLPVTAGVPIHQLLFTENHVGAFDTRFKVLPPLRTRQDRAGLLRGVANGHIAVICSDHKPHGADSRLAPFSEAAPGIAGLDTLLTLTLGLVARGKLELSTAVAALTVNPARIIGVDRGHLSVGAVADCTVFDPAAQWTLDERSMHSRGRNSPLLGERLNGRVTHTLLGGRRVYRA